MRILILFGLFLIIPSLNHAETLRMIRNQDTGKRDYITVLTSTTLPSGSTFYVGIGYTPITSTYTMLTSDKIIDCSTTTLFTVYISTIGLSAGFPFTIFDSSGTITVQPIGGALINGASNYVLRSYFESINIFSDTVNFKIR